MAACLAPCQQSRQQRVTPARFRGDRDKVKLQHVPRCQGRRGWMMCAQARSAHMFLHRSFFQPAWPSNIVRACVMCARRLGLSDKPALQHSILLQIHLYTYRLGGACTLFPLPTAATQKKKNDKPSGPAIRAPTWESDNPATVCLSINRILSPISTPVHSGHCMVVSWHL